MDTEIYIHLPLRGTRGNGECVVGRGQNLGRERVTRDNDPRPNGITANGSGTPTIGRYPDSRGRCALRLPPKGNTSLPLQRYCWLGVIPRSWSERWGMLGGVKPVEVTPESSVLI